MNSIRQAIEDNAAARVENTEAIRAVDFNGHTPDDEPASDYDRGWRAGYNAAVDAIVGKLAEQAQAQLDEVLTKMQRPAA